MPELSALTDQEIADSLNYARRRFAGLESALTAAQVRAQREKKSAPQK